MLCMVTRRTRTRDQHKRRPREAWRIYATSGQPRNFESSLAFDWRPFHRSNSISTLTVVTLFDVVARGCAETRYCYPLAEILGCCSCDMGGADPSPLQNKTTPHNMELKDGMGLGT
jgi:hypothetical protein